MIRAWSDAIYSEPGRWAGAASAGWRRLRTRAGWSRRSRAAAICMTCAAVLGAASAGVMLCATAALYHVYFDREDLPNVGPLARFEFPTIGHVYDAGGQPLIELARERREVMPYEDIPPVVREAILAAEDKH